MTSEHEPDRVKILRRDLHASVDRALDGFLAETGLTVAGAGTNSEPNVMPLEGTGKWTYRWPDGVEELFYESRWYQLTAGDTQLRIRVAWTRRPAWGRDDRERAVVFHHLGSQESATYYPWTEFVETDDNRFAASIPDPRRPRATLSDLDDLPLRFASAIVERSDHLFTSIAVGPSLRLVLERKEEEAMVKHGYWVAILRNRI